MNADGVLFVLGGSSGIGLEVARLAIARGLDVRLTASNEVSAERASVALSGRAAVHVLDLRTGDEQSIRDLTREADFLVLSSGVEYVGPAEHEPPASLRDTIAVNVTGPLLAVAGCLPSMVARGRGLVIGIGSVVAPEARPFLASYGATKTALDAYLRSVREEVEPLGVDVEILSLGPIATNLGTKGPQNWIPDKTSPYIAAFEAARLRAHAERTCRERLPYDVAHEVMRIVDRHKEKRRA